MTGFRLRPAQLGTAGVFALAGLIFWTSCSVSQGNDIRKDDPLLRLSDLIRERGRENARQEASTARLRAEVQELREQDHSLDPAERRRLAEVERVAGLHELSGEGLTVTLDDAPPDAVPLVSWAPEPSPDDLVIHQQDLQSVVNALWAGGAEGIQIMDQRLISTSAVRCVGNTLILQGQLYSPPYVITAVGDPEALRQAMEDSEAIRIYQRYVEAYGLGWEVTEHSGITLPGYTGSVELQYAVPAGPDDDGDDGG
ncbi:DUF881 domain-containing protein [Streptomyces aidingensis]|uniref:Uncharacterized conserved protein YlxW, UPF0749 family n=1 Tax=Streptomyces aidingensis TaxID=910347 RepID=A0A1I1QLT7_9ACTN|nr:DUF881 domain-containing protein [Streptomyces aidingensis]SFD22977.1 Uncharacterized conserved protein YlxW, UPF0749 family [Streptomyces aidingensis]